MWLMPSENECLAHRDVTSLVLGRMGLDWNRFAVCELRDPTLMKISDDSIHLQLLRCIQ
jgi:hypothetical protein